MSEILDTVTLITGASRGLGREIALRFSEEGARVALVSRDKERLNAVAAEAPNQTVVAPADVRVRKDVEEAVNRTVSTFGSIDTLINNAGVSQLGLRDERQRTGAVPEETWDRIVETNLKSPFLFSKMVIPHMIEQGAGNIVNISSGLGRRAAPGAGPYVSSKWGLEGLTRTMSMEYSDDGINVNALDPGGRVDTAIWDHLPADERSRILDPGVMNDAAVCLASQSPGGVTGESMDAAAWEDRLR